jgi:RND family efflux transporter MFP subunit
MNQQSSTPNKGSQPAGAQGGLPNEQSEASPARMDTPITHQQRNDANSSWWKGAATRPKLFRALRLIIFLAVLGGLLAAAVGLVLKKQAALERAPRYGLAPVPVRAALTSHGDLEITREYLAVVEPIHLVELSSRLTAVVEAVTVREGDWVQAGQVLARLESQEIRDAIAGVEAQMAQVQAELAANEATVQALTHSYGYRQREADRLLELLQVDASSASEAEAAEDRASEIAGQLEASRRKSEAVRQQFVSLQARMSELNTRLGYGEIVSPYHGVVSLRHVDPGDLAMPGRPLLVLEDQSEVKLAFDVPQQDLPGMRAGLALNYTVAGGRRAATISKLYPSLNHARMLRAESLLASEPARYLTSGAYVPVTAVLDRLEGITLAPASAVVESPGRESHVFVVENNRLIAVPVQVLGRRGDQVALGGIEPDQMVVISTFLGWTTLSSNLEVEVLQ